MPYSESPTSLGSPNRQCPIVPRQATRSPRFSPKPGWRPFSTGSVTGFTPSTATGASSCSTARPSGISAARPRRCSGASCGSFSRTRARPRSAGFSSRPWRAARRSAPRPSSVIFGGRWLSYRLFPLGDGMGIVFRDMTDRKRAEEQRDLLIKELEHRVKNTLTTVQSIASQSFRTAGVEPRGAARLRCAPDRARQRAQRADQAELGRADLHDVVCGGAAPAQRAGPRPLHRRRAERSGSARKARSRSRWRCTSLPPTRSSTAHCRPRPATWISRWSAADDRFHWHWRERGGPPVTAAGAHRLRLAHDRARARAAAVGQGDDRLPAGGSCLHHRRAARRDPGSYRVEHDPEKWAPVFGIMLKQKHAIL